MPDQTQEQNRAQPTSQGMGATTKGEPEDAPAALRQIGDSTVDTIKKPTTLAAIAGAAVYAGVMIFANSEWALISIAIGWFVGNSTRTPTSVISTIF